MTNVHDAAVQLAAGLGTPPFDTHKLCSARVNNTSTLLGISCTLHNRDLTACATEPELVVPVDFEELYPVLSHCIKPSRPNWCDLPCAIFQKRKGAIL
jgi:hypothetical protein